LRSRDLDAFPLAGLCDFDTALQQQKLDIAFFVFFVSAGTDNDSAKRRSIRSGQVKRNLNVWDSSELPAAKLDDFNAPARLRDWRKRVFCGLENYSPLPFLLEAGVLDPRRRCK
jgi:hypothetical protein